MPKEIITIPKLTVENQNNVGTYRPEAQERMNAHAEIIATELIYMIRRLRGENTKRPMCRRQFRMMSDTSRKTIMTLIKELGGDVPSIAQ